MTILFIGERFLFKFLFVTPWHAQTSHSIISKQQFWFEKPSKQKKIVDISCQTKLLSFHPRVKKHCRYKKYFFWKCQFFVKKSGMLKFKAFTLLTALCHNVFATSLTESSPGCEVVSVLLARILFLVMVLKLQADQFQCRDGVCISLENRWNVNHGTLVILFF